MSTWGRSYRTFCCLQKPRDTFSTAADIDLQHVCIEKQHQEMQKCVLCELFQVSSSVPRLRNTCFFLCAISLWSSDLITCLLSEQSNEVIITQRESINPTQESRRINAPIQAPVIGHGEREGERWRERERALQESGAGQHIDSSHYTREVE